jgi:hypothetical protein
MGEKESYYRRLLKLQDWDHSDSIPHLAESLLLRLEIDFTGERKHFQESEYRDPDFRAALLGLLIGRGTVVYFPRELAALARRIIGDGKRDLVNFCLSLVEAWGWNPTLSLRSGRSSC